LLLILGGAAVYRCDKRIVLAAALAAEGDCCPRDDFSRHPVQQRQNRPSENGLF
jgi:hypothetical protein